MSKLSHCYFASDLHLGHEYMAKIRGFENHSHFFEVLKQNWNEAIPHEHIPVYILGDVVMRKEAFPLLNELNGAKRFVLGNHDLWPNTPREYGKTYPMVVSPGEELVLTHFPVHEMYFMFGQADWCNLHGHLHGWTIDNPRYLNLCLEHTNYRPIDYNEVQRRLKRD